MKATEKKLVSEAEMSELLETGILRLAQASHLPHHAAVAAMETALVGYLAWSVKPDENGDKRQRIREILYGSLEILLSSPKINTPYE